MNVQYALSRIQIRKFCILYSCILRSAKRYRSRPTAPPFGFWILDSGFWILDSGFWIPSSLGSVTHILGEPCGSGLHLYSGFWILDSGFLAPWASLGRDGRSVFWILYSGFWIPSSVTHIFGESCGSGLHLYSVFWILDSGFLAPLAQ